MNKERINELRTIIRDAEAELIKLYGDVRYPPVGTPVSFVWDDKKLNGKITSHANCVEGCIETTVTQARKKSDNGIYVVSMDNVTVRD